MKIIIFLLCFVFATVPTQASTVRVSLFPNEHIINFLQIPIWGDINPIKGDLPSVIPANFNCCTNFIQVKIKQTSTTKPSYGYAEGVGFSLNWIGFSTVISWTLDWNYEKNSSVLNGESSIIMDISANYTIQNNNGVPNFKILSFIVDNWSVVPANYSLPPALAKAPNEAMQTLIITKKLQNSLMEFIEKFQNSKISTLFGTGVREIPLNLVIFTIPVFVRYTLNGSVVFGAQSLSVELEVVIQLNKNTICPIQDKLPTLNQNHTLLISVSRTIFDCLFHDIASTDFGLYAQENKIVDSRFQANIFATPTASWALSNISTNFFSTNFNLPVSGLLKTVFPMNKTVYDLATFRLHPSAKLQMKLENGKLIFGIGNNSFSITELNCNATANSPLLNNHYSEQLKKENWGEVTNKVMSLLIPGIYNQISMDIPEWSLINLLFTNIGWSVFPDWLTIQADSRF